MAVVSVVFTKADREKAGDRDLEGEAAEGAGSDAGEGEGRHRVAQKERPGGCRKEKEGE